MNATELKGGLGNFYGTEKYHFNPLYRKLNYTDGVQFFAQNAGNGAYWFLDIVGTEIHPKFKAMEEFLSITLKSDGSVADIVVDDGNNNVLWTRHIALTDCPEGEWKFFLTNDVLLLPSEY